MSPGRILKHVFLLKPVQPNLLQPALSVLRKKYFLFATRSRAENGGGGEIYEGKYRQRTRLNSTAKPNPVMSIPEILLTHCQF